MECTNLNVIGIMSHDNIDNVTFHIDVLDRMDGNTHQFWNSEVGEDIKTW